MKTAAFDIMLNGVRVDTVFQPAYLKPAQVRNQLIERSGYDVSITVERLG